MKVAIVIAILFVLVYLSEGLSMFDIMKHTYRCKKEVRCRENLFKSIRGGHIPQSNKGLNGVYCVYKNIHVITEDNTVDENALTSFLVTLKLSENKAADLSQKCASKFTGNSNAAATKSLLSCITSHNGRKHKSFGKFFGK